MTVTIPPPPDSSYAQSPFTPTFGATPPALVGRQQEVNDFAYAIDSGPGATGRATLVTGQRGVGKSVMLNVYHEVAASRQWLSLHAQASPGFARSMTEARLPEVIDQLDSATKTRARTVGGNVSILGVGAGFTNRVEETNTLTPDFRHQLMRVLGELDAHGTGLLITLDEVHRSQLSELHQVTDALSYAFSQQAPLAFIAAGLPQTINGLVNADVSTYLRRAERVELGNLSPEDTRIALEMPIREAGRTIRSDALDAAAAGSGRYPYLVQLIGDLTWKAAGDSETITEAHVQSALDSAERSMYRQIHEPAVEALSDRERDYLAAMAEDSGRSQTAAVAARMGVSMQYASVYRDRLITQGMIEAAGRGYVSYAIPYTRDYLLSRPGHERSSITDDQ